MWGKVGGEPNKIYNRVRRRYILLPLLLNIVANLVFYKQKTFLWILYKVIIKGLEDFECANDICLLPYSLNENVN